MHSNGSIGIAGSSARRILLEQYIRLLRESRYAGAQHSQGERTAEALCQMGRNLIGAGLEDDLDRLLRFRVLEGGLARPSPARTRSVPHQLHVLESCPTT